MKNINLTSIGILSRQLLVFSLLLTTVVACSDDDPALPDNVISFQSGELGISTEEAALDVNIALSRAVAEDVSLAISFVAEGVTYGTDFTISPAPVSSTFVVTVLAGSNEASFSVEKGNNVVLDGDEKIIFTISSASDEVVIGSQSQLTLSFAEILSQGAIIDISGGGATYSNKVFLDLSANRQTAVERTAWDLGFYMQEDDFRVVLNNSVAMMARALDKNDLASVTADDTVGFKNEMVLASAVALPWIDDPSGDLTKTAVASVSDVVAENQVYIINRGAGIGSPALARGWKKVRIIRNGTGYTLQHADIAATAYSEIQIPKDDAYRFRYILFETGIVDVEPVKEKWDIAWTYFVNTTAFGPDVVPYGFQDVVLQNLQGVETAKVLTSTVAYENFSEGDLAGLTFSASQTAIGADWRRTSPSPAIVYEDRFYAIRDAAGNYYKLKFNLILRDGVRGTPQVEYALLKAGN
jgi:hypothetical protein